MKQREYADYEELGRCLYEAQTELTHGITKASNMWPLQHDYVRRLRRIADELGEVRSEMDSEFCQEFREGSNPPGSRPFPLYPGPREEART